MTVLSHESQLLGFFVESFESNGCGSEAVEPSSLPWLSVPSSGVAHLALTDASPNLLPDDSEPTSDCVALERSRYDYRTYWTMLAPGRFDLRINDRPAGPVSILKPKDQLQVAANYALHVSALIKPYTGPPDDADVGQECLVCRTRVLSNQTIFRCPLCDVPLHAGGPDRPEHDRLECSVTATDCPRCRSVMVREEGYSYVPEF